jgi:DNA-binding NtrC family response regulator
VPPLRDRFEDIIGLCHHFIERFSTRYDGRKLEFTSDAESALTQYNWPGNVRELENVIESLLALAPEDLIDVEILPKKILQPVNPSGIDFQPTNVFEGSLKFGDAEKRFESEMIIKALKRTNYVQTKAAELLGISRRILKYKMDKLGIPASAD